MKRNDRDHPGRLLLIVAEGRDAFGLRRVLLVTVLTLQGFCGRVKAVVPYLDDNLRMCDEVEVPVRIRGRPAL